MTVTTRALLVTAALLLASTACVHGALTATQIVDAINGLTVTTQKVQTYIDKTVFYDPSGTYATGGFGAFPVIIQGLQDIASAAKAFTDQLNNPPSVPSNFDVDATAAAFSTFVQAHKKLMRLIVNIGPPVKAAYIGEPMRCMDMDCLLKQSSTPA